MMVSRSCGRWEGGKGREGEGDQAKGGMNDYEWNGCLSHGDRPEGRRIIGGRPLACQRGTARIQGAVQRALQRRSESEQGSVQRVGADTGPAVGSGSEQGWATGGVRGVGQRTRQLFSSAKDRTSAWLLLTALAVTQTTQTLAHLAKQPMAARPTRLAAA